MAGKFILYQLLLRVFGNTNENCVPGGSFQLNGSGKFNSITPEVLENLKELSVTHIWYTGVIEHATNTSFEKYGIKRDHSIVVKGEAGSPYAIKDYYDVNPCLAHSVNNRMDEFQALVERTHSAGLKVIIDFVPNHLAREYFSDSAPEGVADFGVGDNPLQAFSPLNNFYYLPGEKLNLEEVSAKKTTPLFSAEYANKKEKGEDIEKPDEYVEFPAKATGNDCFSASPSVNDWYETVKLNYGVDYLGGGANHFSPRPKTWDMMLDVLLFWASKGVDGFRCDMAEMVPVEFWHWAVSEVKKRYPSLVFIAEVYDPQRYDAYLHFGGFDYLYDKVGLYDNLKAITQSCAGTANCGGHPVSQARSITNNWQSLGDMQYSMLNFLENHDEQRIASDFNIGDPFKALPSLVVSLMLNTAPFMLYFGQEFGEKGMLQEGFSGLDGRTSIFDYCSAPSVVRYLKSLLNRSFGEKKPVSETDAKKNELEEKEYVLYLKYIKLLSIAMGEEAIKNGYTYDLEYANESSPGFDPVCHFAFARRSRKTIDNYTVRDELILIAVDFSQTARNLPVILPKHLFDVWNIPAGNYEAVGLLDGSPLSLTLAQDAAVELPVNPDGIAIVKVVF